MLTKKLLPYLALLLMGAFTTACTPETDGVRPSEDVEIDGRNTFSIDGVERPLGFGYDMSEGSQPEGFNFHNIVLTTSDVETDGRLTGRSDMVGFYLVTDGDGLGEGSYRVDSDFSTGMAPGTVIGGMYCQNMNFTTGSADDDEPTVNGTLTVTREDENFVLDLDFELNNGAPLTGRYTGPLKQVGY